MPMRRVLLDTPVWVSSFAHLGSLSEVAVRVISNAETVYVSQISVMDLGQKIRLGHWPEMHPVVHRLADIPEEQGAQTAKFSPEIFRYASNPEWAHIDPFDRLIAATAEFNDMLLVTRRAVFSDLPNLRHIW
ncbi:type II toxin-antitoxin system VapC family toxin [Amaricoccus tamworthensis]|uniref:type II toxin-antitoxin system VapC family toxin n=1 Tax=Amaricoccus tamworthensis TaxID=57002 RepID=UPI003C7DAB9E